MPRKTVAAGHAAVCIGAASMRPRPDAAENPTFGGRAGSGSGRRFNEAAARCRGKPHSRRSSSAMRAAVLQ